MYKKVPGTGSLGCMDQFSFWHAGTCLPSVIVRWDLKGTWLQWEHAAIQESLLWPDMPQFEHKTSWCFGLFTSLSLKYSKSVLLFHYLSKCLLSFVRTAPEIVLRHSVIILFSMNAHKFTNVADHNMNVGSDFISLIDFQVFYSPLLRHGFIFCDNFLCHICRTCG